MIELINNYGIFGFIRLVRDVLYTKIIISNKARIVRYPFYIRGKKYIKFGNMITTGVGLRIDAFPENKSNEPCITFGDNVQINDYVHIAAISSIRIGNNVLIASKVFITDHNHGDYGINNNNDSPYIPPIMRPLRANPVIIEDNVWIGEHVSILPGVKVGKGTVIGAQSVVTKDIPPNSIAVGVPARVIKKYNDENGKWYPIKS
jgi:acetyltransferase-like isoleucine patch superfamily enzyme